MDDIDEGSLLIRGDLHKLSDINGINSLHVNSERLDNGSLRKKVKNMR